MEGDNNETNKDVHHKEGDDDNVYDEEDGDLDTVVVDGTHVLSAGVDGLVQQTAQTQDAEKAKIGCLFRKHKTANLQ